MGDEGGTHENGGKTATVVVGSQLTESEYPNSHPESRIPDTEWAPRPEIARSGPLPSNVVT